MVVVDVVAETAAPTSSPRTVRRSRSTSLPQTSITSADRHGNGHLYERRLTDSEIYPPQGCAPPCPGRDDPETNRDVHGATASVLEPRAVWTDAFGSHNKLDSLEVALVKKLDRRIIPIILVMYLLSYVDRSAFAAARPMGIERHLGLATYEYEACISILFVGYMLGQTPSNMLLTRAKPSAYLSCMMALWALISGTTAFCKSFRQLLVTRLALGVAESAFFPGAVYVLSSFYRRKEVASRISWFYLCSILAMAFNFLLAGLLYERFGQVRGVKEFQLLFLIIGVATLLAAVCAFFLLPDKPRTTPWLTEEERQLATRRIGDEMVGIRHRTGVMGGFKQAAGDPAVWLFTAMGHCHLIPNGIRAFFPTVIESLGFNITIVFLMTASAYVAAAACTFAVTASSRSFSERTWFITVSKSLAFVGFVLAAVIRDVAGRYAAIILFTSGTYAVNSLVVSWAATVCDQTQEKKAAAVGIIGTVQNLALVWTPFVWPKSDGPRYIKGMTVCATASALVVVLAWRARVMVNKRNRDGDNSAK